MTEHRWISGNQLPANIDYGWSDRMLISQFKPGDRHPMLLIASYNFSLGQWRSAMGTIENVTHYQPLPDYPGECVNQHEMPSNLTTILQEAINLLEVHRFAFEDEADNIGCGAGNPDGGSTQDCSHCQLMRAIEEIDQILNKVPKSAKI